jgi:hypothetical protein
MPKHKAQVPTLPELIRRTARLRRDLIKLMERHAEDDLDLGDRSFVRLLNPMWRNPYGKQDTSEQQKEIETVGWINEYWTYFTHLDALLGLSITSHSRAPGAPERPVQRRRVPSKAQCAGAGTQAFC